MWGQSGIRHNEVRIKGNMSIDNKSVQKFWRFHPVTGEDANLFDTTQLSEDERAELAQMVRDGAKLTGVRYEFLDTAQ